MKNVMSVDLVLETIFCSKLAAILDFESLICHPQKQIFRGQVCVIVIIRIWAMKIPNYDVSTFFLDGHIENGRFDPFLHRNANGNMSHLKEQKKML